MNFELLLAQVTPSSAAATTGYAPTLRSVVTRIVVCNAKANPSTFSVYHDDDGTTFSTATALYKNKAIAGNSTEVIRSASLYSGIGMRRGGALGVEAGTADGITFSLYGYVEPYGKG